MTATAATPSPLLAALDTFPERMRLPDYRRFADPVFIHCCKDGTCSLRRLDEPVFNGVALPVYVVPSMEAAIQLQVLMCFRVPREHVLMPGKPWYKFNDVRTRPTLSTSCDPRDDPTMRLPVFEVEDLGRLTAKIDACYKTHIRRTRPSDL